MAVGKTKRSGSDDAAYSLAGGNMLHFDVGGAGPAGRSPGGGGDTDIALSFARLDLGAFVADAFQDQSEAPGRASALFAEESESDFGAVPLENLSAANLMPFQELVAQDQFPVALPTALEAPFA